MAYIGREPQIGNYQVCDAISVVNAQAAYTMQVDSVNVIPESVNHMIVSLNGVIQKPGSSYTISSSTITFSSNLATGDSIDFIYLLGNVLDLGTPSDDTVTGAKIVDNAINSEHYTDASIDLAHMSANSIDSNQYVDGSIDTAHIADAQITVAKMAANSIDSDQYVDGSIDTAHIADDAITLAKMAAGTDGNIISFDASGNPVAIATGNDGQVLTSTGAGSPPAFEDVSGGVTFKQAGANFTNSLLVGNSQTGTLSSADRNTGVGIGVFNDLTQGDDNVALGYNCLTACTTGTENIAIGAHALDAQISGSQNVGIGHGALGKCTDNKNTAIGRTALDNVTSGEGNVAVGFSSGAEGSYQNFTTEDNRAVFGHGSITHSYVKVDWTVGSDIRDKNNIGTVPHGIDFVKQLNPISYQFRIDRSGEEVHGPVRYGFSAQDVLALEKANGGTNVIVDDEFPLHLNFTNSNLTAVLVNAIKELEVRIKTLEDA